MVTKDEAEEIVLRYFSGLLQFDIKLGIYKDRTTEFEDGYVVHFNAQDAIDDPYTNQRISGIFPAIVEKQSGKVIYLRMDGSAKALIEAYYEKSENESL